MGLNQAANLIVVADKKKLQVSAVFTEKQPLL